MNSKSSTFITTFESKVFADAQNCFNDLCIELFQFQVENNVVYKEYCRLLNCDVAAIEHYSKIPFLPISAFKSHELKCGNFEAAAIFSSSGTTGNQTSRHFVNNLETYGKSFNLAFERFYGNVEGYCVLGLLPSYLERQGSSLIYMVNNFIEQSTHEQSGFFLDNQQELFDLLQRLSNNKEKVLLIGVSFALLDFVEQYDLKSNDNLVVMETGGMKGRRKELVREELHSILQKGFSTEKIHSEYGMTELLSQAYSKGNGVFETPPWMKILIREQDDPLQLTTIGQAGVMNIIDLANTGSCAFIQTDDLGKKLDENRFEVLGRQDISDVRGCNLMVN
ncbi:MAG: hypothetical protein ACI9DK_002458 [Vicingaceae bacterium]